MMHESFKDHPQNCPHCDGKIDAAWVEGFGRSERFYLKHSLPLCRAGSERMECFPLSTNEIEHFRHWSQKYKNDHPG